MHFPGDLAEQLHKGKDKGTHSDKHVQARTDHQLGRWVSKRAKHNGQGAIFAIHEGIHLHHALRLEHSRTAAWRVGDKVSKAQ
eukprot:1157823-Pelagomonas_calceolata.AAC.6